MPTKWTTKDPRYPKRGRVTMNDHELDTRLDRIDVELQSLSAAANRVLDAARLNSSSIDAVEQNLRGQLDMLNTAQQRTSTKVDSLHQAFTDFVEQDSRDKQRLFAHAALLTVRSEIETKYGQYEDVRRNVRGMLLAL